MKKNKQPRQPRNRATVRNAPRSKIVAVTKKKQGNYDYGSQLSSVVKRGYGRTLASFPTTRAFGKVYLDPFSTESARLPDFPVYPSTLIRLEVEVVVTSGTGSGPAWIYACPLNMITNDQQFAWYTVGGAVPPAFTTTIGTTVNAAVSGSPYGKSYFDSSAKVGRSVRCVAWGMCVQNISSTLNRGGKYFFNQPTPRLTDPMTGTDNSAMTLYPTYKTGTLGTAKALYYHRMITERSDLRYNQELTGSGWVYADDGALSSERDPYIGCYLACAGITTPETFSVRMAGHFEIVGQTRNAPGLGTTVSDTKGLEQIVSSGHMARTKDAESPDHISGKSDRHQDSVVDSILHATTDILPPGGKRVADNLIDVLEDKLNLT